jgi:hypothetical protein
MVSIVRVEGVLPRPRAEVGMIASHRFPMFKPRERLAIPVLRLLFQTSEALNLRPFPRGRGGTRR